MIARLRNLSYARRAGVVAALGVLVIAAITITVVLLSGRALRDQARARSADTAQLSARLLEEQSRRLGDLVSSLAVHLEGVSTEGGRLSEQDEPRVARVLAELKQRDGIVVAFFVDREGNVLRISPSDPATIGENFAFRDWYQGVTNIGSPYVSKAYKSEQLGGQRVVAVAALVRTPARVEGILVAVERGETQRFVDTFAREEGTSVTVMDQSGVIVAGSGVTGEDLSSRKANPSVAAALKGRQSIREETVNGNEVISAFAPVRNTGWAVRSDIRTDEAFSDIGRIRGLVIALALLFTSALIALAVALARNATRSAREKLNERLQAQLLPRVKLKASDIAVNSLYRPGEDGMLIGGDFHDAVELEDGRVAVVVGDVVGHGPDAAALGAALRAGWRALTLSGTDPGDMMAALDRAVLAERRQPDAFASAVFALVSADRTRVTLCLAGHPPPMIMLSDGAAHPAEADHGPLLGVMDHATWPVTDVSPGGPWSMLLYTDGLVEGSIGSRHLAVGGGELESWIATLPDPSILDSDALWALVEQARRDSGGTLADDVALVAITVRPRAYEHASGDAAEPVSNEPG